MCTDRDRRENLLFVFVGDPFWPRSEINKSHRKLASFVGFSSHIVNWASLVPDTNSSSITTTHHPTLYRWAWMAVPPNNQTDIITMLEVENAKTNPTRSDGTMSQLLPYRSQSGNGYAPVMISMTQDEYSTRTSRETVLKRLSEALLRRSLAKVCSVDSFVPLLAKQGRSNK